MTKKLVKLTCSTPNKYRDGQGIAYYVCGNLHRNFSCDDIHEQLKQIIPHIHIDPSLISVLRKAYKNDLAAKFGLRKRSERMELEKALKVAEEALINLTRKNVERLISDAIFLQLSKEYEAKVQLAKTRLEAMKQEPDFYIKGFEDALRLLTKLGILYFELDQQKQRELLLHLVNRVVINPEGIITRVELHPPFAYLKGLLPGEGVKPPSGNPPSDSRNNTSRVSAAGSSIQVSFNAPHGA